MVQGIHKRNINTDLLENVGKSLDEIYRTTFITIRGAGGNTGSRQYRWENDERELWRVRDEILAQSEPLDFSGILFYYNRMQLPFGWVPGKSKEI